MTENEKKKEYLKSYKNLCIKIKSLERQLQELRESKSSAQAIIIDDMPRGTNQGDLSDYAVRVDELEIKIEDLKSECLNRKLDIENSIADMDNGLESDILHKRYIEFMEWEKICVSINYSWMQTHRFHSNALKNFLICNGIE